MADQPRDQPADRPPARRSAARRSARPTARHLVVSLALALVAATLTYVVVSAIADGGDDPATAVLEPARPAPTTTFDRLDGGTTSLAAYAGRPVVLNFFAESCAPCRREMPDLQRIEEEIGDRVAVVGVDQGDTEEVAAAFVAEMGVTFDVGLDPTGELARAFGVDALPGTVFITPDGEIDGVHRGRLTYDELRRLVDEHFL